MQSKPALNGKTELSQAERDKILEPDLNSDSFHFGRNPDGSVRTWKLKPLPWKYEKHFRKQALPLLTVAYKPFETLLKNLRRDYLPLPTDTGLVGSVFDAETEIDEYLSRAVHAILLAQETTVTVEWVDDMAESREQLLNIVMRQCELHKIMDRLGESLAERLGKLAQMMGVEIDLPSLRRLWKQVSEVLSDRIMKAVSTVDNVIGLSTENSSETTSQTPESPSEIKFIGNKPIVRVPN